MRISATCILLLLTSFASLGQSYRYAQIKDQADSLLSNKLGWDVFQYCKVNDADSYYSYEKKKKEHFKKLTRKHPRKHLVSATISYRLVMPYPKCPCMDTIAGNITISLDSALRLTEDIDNDIIPYFVTQHDSCHFITKEKAIAIALQQNLHTSVATPYAYIKRHTETHLTSGEVKVEVKDVYYTWVVLRTIWNEKSTSANNRTTDDMVVIDAVTGEVKENKVIPYAPHVY